MTAAKLSNHSDEKLFELIKKGNELAFDTLYNRYWEVLYTKTASLLSDESAAQDIIQNLFIKLWIRRAEIRNDNIVGFLFKVAKQESLLHLRKGKISQRVLDHATRLSAGFSNDTEEVVNFNQVNEQYESSLKSMPHKTQEVFKLSRIEKLTNQEISNHLKISVKTVEYHISNALKHLRAHLTEFTTVVLLFSVFYSLVA